MGHISRRRFLHGAASGILPVSIGLGRTAQASSSGPFEATWASLDAHDCPEWFRDAKLGMYFHWGVSAVPGWAPRKDGISYAEWYWHAMNDEKNPTHRYHRETWGPDFTYDDFFPLFGAERYDPADWVSFAKSSGARYLFVNAKHHDGYCLWPTKYTDRSAFRTGPKRDLITPLVEAARREGLKIGFYYSFYEWYNPLYTKKPLPYAGLIPVDDYVDDFMAPQVRELIDRYRPDFMYFDGEWDHPPGFWKSRELVAYYYNQAAARGQDVLVNDRYGKGFRGKHGDVYNVEYHFGSESEGLLDHPWSYWRGIAKTFGYNRDTRPADCLTPRELIHMFVDGVSRNGNFDINVGPAPDGSITDVERYPLRELGKWLAVNGEAIYGTRPWRTGSDGDVRFTVKDGWVYAIFLAWQGERFRIPSVTPEEGSPVTMLGVPGELVWRRENGDIVVEYPAHRPLPTECAWAWAFKIRPREI